MEACSGCGKAKANLKCGICEVALCKACTQFLEPDAFAFLTKRPKELSHGTYCEPCYSKTVAPALNEYQQKLAAAREIMVFEKSQAKETRLIRKNHDLIHIKDCPDHDEAILRMAFRCVELQCNALIEVDLKATKIRNGKYQTSSWSGSGRPANFEKDQEVKDRSIRSNPN